MKKLFTLVFLCGGTAGAVSGQMCQTVGNAIRAVTVNDLGEPVIGWDAPADLPAQATGYIVYDYLGGVHCTQEVARVGLGTHSYTDVSALPLTGTRRYSLAVNTSTEPLPITRQHAFPFLTAAYDSCRYCIDMEWTAYEGWEQEAVYEVYGGAAGMPPVLLAAGITGTRHTLADVPDNVAYRVHVVARHPADATVESASNRVALQTETAQRPAVFRIDSIAAVTDEVMVHFTIDRNTQLPDFSLVREHGGSTATLYTFNKWFRLYPERNVVTANQYRLTAANYCGMAAGQSNVLNNMLLIGEQHRGVWQLRWNALLDAAPTYSLYRLQPNPAQLLAHASETSFHDPVDTEAAGLSYCYRVVAHGTGVQSSAEQCFVNDPQVLLPNAVAPRSRVRNTAGWQRNWFAPVVSAHYSTYAYRLTIYNLNGDVVADMEKSTAEQPADRSWQGLLPDGEPAPEGMYLYQVKIMFNTGKTVTRKGSVAVVY